VFGVPTFVLLTGIASGNVHDDLNVLVNLNFNLSLALLHSTQKIYTITIGCHLSPTISYLHLNLPRYVFEKLSESTARCGTTSFLDQDEVESR
jgi:hypothetical protein